MAGVGVAIVGGLAAIVQKSTDAAKGIEFTSQRIGISTDALQELGFVAGKSGVDIGQFEIGMGKLSKTMTAAIMGNKSSLAVFKAAGVSIKDQNGNLKDSTRVVEELSNKFKAAKDGPLKTGLAMMLFGRSGRTMIPMLNRGGQAIDEMSRKFKDSNAYLSGENIAAFKKYRTAIGETKHQMEGLKNQISIALLPKATELMDKVAALADKFSNWIKKNKELFASIVKWTAKVGVALIALGAFNMVIGTVLRSISLISKAHAAYTLIMNSATVATKIATINQWLLNSAIGIGLGPVIAIIAGIAALTAGVLYCWNHFAKFRAIILTTWETIKGFGGILKDYVIDRIKGIISGLGSMGKAIGLLFHGKFSAAYDEAKKGVRALSGYDAKLKAIGRTKALVTNISQNYTQTLAKEYVKDREKGWSKSGQLVSDVQKKVSSTTTRSNSNTSQVHKRELEQIIAEINRKNQRLSYMPI
ncbi:phage tail tape measure protein [Candidatus Nomurabacteria bacterium]|nr:phage tail tape measure protein [Candidatus Nomurabacteria bacterium]